MNLLFNEDQLSGMIDLGEFIKGIAVADCVIALANIMLNKENPLKACVTFLSSYHKEFAL